MDFCGHTYFSVEKLRDPTSRRRAPACTKIKKPNSGLFYFGAPARTRTWNDGSEDRCDIHFTTSAMELL